MRPVRNLQALEVPVRLVRNPAAEYDFTGEYHVEQSIDKEEKKVLDASVHGYCTVMSMSIND